jgi:hypothetical protein
MVVGESGRRTIELSPVRGNRRGTDVRQVLGIYLGGGGWEEVRRYASRGVLGCTGGESRILRVCHCTQPSERRSSTRVLHPVLTHGEGTLAASQSFPISLSQTVPANASAQSHPLLTGPSPLNVSSRPTPCTSSESTKSSRTVSVSKISREVSPFRAPPLRCWCRPKSIAAFRGTRCSAARNRCITATERVVAVVKDLRDGRPPPEGARIFVESP